MAERRRSYNAKFNYGIRKHGARYFAVEILIPIERVVVDVCFSAFSHWWLEQNTAADLFNFKTKYKVTWHLLSLFPSFTVLSLLHVSGVKRPAKWSWRNRKFNWLKWKNSLRRGVFRKKFTVQVISGRRVLYLFFAEASRIHDFSHKEVCMGLFEYGTEPESNFSLKPGRNKPF